MITQDTSAEGVFSEPTMGPFITDWQREKVHLTETEGHVRSMLEMACASPDRSQYEIQDAADYLSEDIDGLSDDELDDEPRHDLLSNRDLEWVRREREQQSAVNEAKERVLEHASVLGADDFALYGIGKYLKRPDDGLSLGDVLSSAVATETRLRTVDEEVRKNTGNQIFYIYPGNVTAAVLTEGGITIDFEGDQTVIPTKIDSVVGAILIRDMYQTYYRSDGLLIDTRHVVSSKWLLMDSLEFLRMNRLSLVRGFAFGNIPEGPLFADNGDRANRTFLHMAGNRIRIAGQASLDPSYELDLRNKTAA